MDDQIGGLLPAQVTKHHLGRENQRTGVHFVQPSVFGRSAVGGLKHGVFVRDIGARCDTDATDLRRQGVGDIVAIQIQRGDDVVFGRPQQNLLQKRIGDGVLDDDAVGQLHPRPAIEHFGAELVLGQRVGPITEATLGELHDVALVDDGHALAAIVDGVLDSRSHQSLRALTRHRLDADAGGVGKTDLLHTHLGLQEGDELLRALGLRLPLDTGVNVLGVLAEDDHIGLGRILKRARHALEVLHRAHALVEIEFLAQRDVE